MEEQKLVNSYTRHSGLTYGEATMVFVEHIVEKWDIGENSVFVDVGSGIGQVCCMIRTMSSCKDVTGVEIREELHELALHLRRDVTNILRDRKYTHYRTALDLNISTNREDRLEEGFSGMLLSQQSEYEVNTDAEAVSKASVVPGGEGGAPHVKEERMACIGNREDPIHLADPELEDKDRAAVGMEIKVEAPPYGRCGRTSGISDEVSREEEKNFYSLICENVVEADIDWSRVNVVFANNMRFSEKLNQIFSRVMKSKLPFGAVVISTQELPYWTSPAEKYRLKALRELDGSLPEDPKERLDRSMACIPCYAPHNSFTWTSNAIKYYVHHLL